MDLDRGFFTPANYLIDFYLGREVWPFKELMQNEGYRQYFGKRLADHLYTTFSSQRMNRLISKHMNDKTTFL